MSERYGICRSESGDSWWVLGLRDERLFRACEDDAIAVCSLLNLAYDAGVADERDATLRGANRNLGIILRACAEAPYPPEIA